MKSIICTTARLDGKPVYPILKATDGNKIIVLFTSPNTGTCVYSTDNSNKVGQHETCWAEYKLFQEYGGTVTIGN